MNKIADQVLATLRWQNRWLDEAITKVRSKQLDPLIAERILDNLPEPEESDTIAGLEKHRTLNADIDTEFSIRDEKIKSLNDAITYGKTVFKKTKVARDKQRRKEANYSARLDSLPCLKLGELPADLKTGKARKMLNMAIDAGLLDDNFQPVKGTTHAQLFMISKGIGVCCNIRGYHAVFYQLWKIKNLKHTKWKPMDGQANIEKLNKVADLDLFREYKYSLFPELK